MLRAPHPRRPAAALLALLAALVALVSLPAGVATAQGDDEPASTTTPTLAGSQLEDELPEAEDLSILPRPTSDGEPLRSGEPGTGIQLLLMGAVLGGMALLVVLGVRDARRKQAARAAAPGGPAAG